MQGSRGEIWHWKDFSDESPYKACSEELLEEGFGKTWALFYPRKFSEKESMGSIAKFYVADNGFPTIYGLKDLGYRMENVVAIELLRREHYFNPLLDVYYWHDRHRDVDFVVTEGFEVRDLIQVCYDVEDLSTKKREINALLKASKEIGCKNLHIITWDYEGVEEVEGRKVRFTPLWKWLLKAS